MLALLDDRIASVQADAAFALGQTPGRLPSSALLKALARTQDATVQRRLVEALGKKGDGASLVSLVSCAWQDTAQSAEVALAIGRYALRGHHAPEAVDYLINKLSDDDPLGRLHAAYYFARSRDTTTWAPRADTIRTLLDSLPPEAPTAMHLVLGISRLRNLADTPRLLHALKTAEDWRTRVNAVRALSARTDEQGIRAALYDRLVDPSVHVAVAAAQALNDGKAWSDKDVDLIMQWTTYNAYAWRITAPLLEGLAQQDETACRPWPISPLPSPSTCSSMPRTARTSAWRLRRSTPSPRAGKTTATTPRRDRPTSTSSPMASDGKTRPPYGPRRER